MYTLNIITVITQYNCIERHNLHLFLFCQTKKNGVFSVQNKITWTKRKNFYELCSSPYIRRIIKSLVMWCAGHVACMRQTREAFKIFVEPEGKTVTLNAQTYVERMY